MRKRRLLEGSGGHGRNKADAVAFSSKRFVSGRKSAPLAAIFIPHRLVGG